LINLWPLPSQFPCGACHMNKLSEYVKVAEAAQILGVSQGTVRSWAEAGKIPMHRNPANGYRLFLRTDLELWLRRVAQPVNTAPRRKPR
jgi:excisionase family DNA binding protein